MSTTVKMSTTIRFPSTVKLYVAGLCLLGLVLLVQLPQQMPKDLIGLATFIVLGSLAQLMPLHFHKNASVSMSMGVALATILVFGPVYAAWVNVASSVVQYWTLIRPKNKPLYRSVATAAILVIAAWSAGQFYYWLGGGQGASSLSLTSFLALVLAAILYYVINSSLVTAAIALEAHQPFWQVLGENLQFLTLNIASLTPLGFGVAFVYLQLSSVGLALYLLPMALAWYSFSLYSRTAEETRRTNEELKMANDLVQKTNDELQKANGIVQERNQELNIANEQLNIMYEVSRSLVGTLQVDDTLTRVMSAIKLMGFSEGFVAGQLNQREHHVGCWRASHPAYAQWMLVDADRAIETPLRKLVVDLRNQEWFAAGEIQVAPSGEFHLETAGFGNMNASTDALGVLTLVPISIGREPWGVVGIGSAEAPSEAVLKELLIFRSMTSSALEVALAHEQAQRDAQIDAMTGLYNHRYFQEALQRELQDATKRDSFLSFLMIDINKFKEFNDLYGHATGDQVLQVIARLVRENIRETDIACRYGGDEMCVLLPHADRARALEVAARIDRAIAAYSFRARRETAREGQTEELSLRVSVGIATFPEAAQTRAGLVEQADRACYRAKALGGGVAAENGRPIEAAAHPTRLQVVK